MYFYLLSFVNEYTSLIKALKPHECRNAWWHFESYVLSYLLPVSLFLWYLPNLIQCAYDKGRKVKIDMMHLKMLDILLLILIMCRVWSTCNKTAFLFYILLQFAKIATYIFVFAYIFKYSVFCGRQCIKFSVILSLAV